MRFDIDEARTISFFFGEDAQVYATPFLLYDMEVVCRDLINEHLDDNEDTVGTHINIAHMAPTPLDMWADITVTITKIEGRKVELEFKCRDGQDKIAKGSHSRFVVDKLKTAEHIKSKMKKATGYIYEK